MRKTLELEEIGFISIALDKLYFEETRNPQKGFQADEMRDLKNFRDEWDCIYRAVHALNDANDFFRPEE